MNQLKLLLISAFLFSALITSAQKPPDGNTGECTPHNNFEELIGYLENTPNAGLWVQVTHVNDPNYRSNQNPSHYFTSFSQGDVDYNADKCQLSSRELTTYFSDRDLFKGKADKVSYVFDISFNEVEVTLHTWGDGKATYAKLQRHKDNMLYLLRDDGSMTIFNFSKQIITLR